MGADSRSANARPDALSRQPYPVCRIAEQWPAAYRRDERAERQQPVQRHRHSVAVRRSWIAAGNGGGHAEYDPTAESDHQDELADEWEQRQGYGDYHLAAAVPGCGVCEHFSWQGEYDRSANRGLQQSAAFQHQRQPVCAGHRTADTSQLVGYDDRPGRIIRHGFVLLSAYDGNYRDIPQRRDGRIDGGFAGIQPHPVDSDLDFDGGQSRELEGCAEFHNRAERQRRQWAAIHLLELERAIV